MILLYQFSILLTIALLYYNFALKYNILDLPNERSSHNETTVRGGGIIFPVAAILWIVFSGLHEHYYFIIGLLIISIVSLLDDFYNINQKWRFLIQLVSCILLLQQFNLFFIPIIILLMTIILMIGWINAYNFMDGINGMTALYSMVFFITLYCISTSKEFININLFEVMIFSILIFSLFNVRKKALMFSGDVGSISLSYIILFIFICYLEFDFNLNYILFFSIYGLDSSITILERVMKKENIFQSHRTHLYQYLANEKKWPHIFVSALYAVLQLFVNILVIYLIIPNNGGLLLLASILIFLSIFYFIIKRAVVNSIIA